MRAPVQVRGVLAKWANLVRTWSGRQDARNGSCSGREGGWYHSPRARLRACGPPEGHGVTRRHAATLDRRDRHHRRPRCCRAVGDRHPRLVPVQPDDRLARRHRLGDARRRHRRAAVRRRECPSRPRSRRPPSRSCSLTGICYVAGLSLTYAAVTIGKVSVVAPIVATEGALAAVIAVALGDTIGLTAGVMLIVIAAGVVLASLEPARPEVPAGGIDITADAHRGPGDARDRSRRVRPRPPADRCRDPPGRDPVGLCRAGLRRRTRRDRQGGRRSCRSPGSRWPRGSSGSSP